MELDDDYGRRCETSGRVLAACWYWRQLLSADLWRLRRRLTRRRVAQLTGAAGRPIRSPGSSNLTSLIHAVAFAFRSLRRSPGFAGAAILTLALGAGANTAIFSVVNGVLLQPPPYVEPDEVVRLRLEGGRFSIPFTPREYVAMQDAVEDLAAMAAYRFQNEAVVIHGDESWLMGSAGVTAALLPMLGVRPALGRAISLSDGEPGAAPVVMISHRVWRTAFGGRDEVLGERISVADSRYTEGIHTVVGVLPDGFDFPDKTVDVWVPLPIDATNEETFGARNENIRILARLADGASTDTAAAQVSALVRGLQNVPAEQEFPYVRVQHFQETRVGEYRERLLLLTAIVAAVLLVAIVNISNLSIARLESRRVELAVRAALGAGRARLAMLVLGEALLIGTIGAALGLLLAISSTRLIVRALPPGIEDVARIEIDWGVFGFALLVSVAAALLAALLPALRSARLGIVVAIRQISNGRGTTAGAWARRPLVIAQIALVVPLVAAAGLMGKSLLRLQAEEPGVLSESVVTMRVDVRQATADDLNATYERITSALRHVTGVESASIVRSMPFSGGSSISSITFVDHPTIPPDESILVDYQVVHAGFFATLGIPLRAGRDFGPDDVDGAPPVVIVNQQFVDTHYPDTSPLGRRFVTGDTFEIVGVAGNIRRRGLGEPARPEMYVHYGQVFNPRGTRRVLVRLDAGRPPTIEQLQDTILDVDSAVAITEVQTMKQVLAASVATERGTTQLMMLFATLALTMASVGLAGTVAYLATRRTREFGIRMALGARSGQVLQLVLGESALLLTLGLGVGLLVALALGRTIASMLYEVEPFDAVTLTLTVGVTAVAVMGAALAPGLRAAGVDPAETLRND